MKVFRVIMKIFAALLAVAGAIYVLAAYGDKIVSWCKMLLDKVNNCCCNGTCCCDSTAEEVISAEVNPPEETPADESDFAEEN